MSRVAPWWQVTPSWAVSFVVHLAILLMLALWGVGQNIRDTILLSVTTASLPEISDSVRVDLSSLSSGASLAAEDRHAGIPESALDLPIAELNPVSLEGPPAQLSGGDQLMDGSEFAGIGQDGIAQQMIEMEGQAEKAAAERANFFGLSARGKRFVFVLDCSGSMGGERWALTVRELLRSVRSLDSDAMFLVLLYSGDTWAMFNTRPADTVLIAAERENVNRLETWLARQFPNGPTFPMRAMNVALQVNPDAIFLLSDGEFQDNTVEFLQENNVIRDMGRGEMKRIPIHTVAMDYSLGVLALRQIATENDGQFRMVNSGE